MLNRISVYLLLLGATIFCFGIAKAQDTITISGKITKSTGEGIGGVVVDLCNNNIAATDDNGNWSINLPSGSSYCVRISSGLAAGYTSIHGTSNNSCHKDNPSYEWQIAGQNNFSSCSYSDSRSWDLDSDDNINFTVTYPDRSAICLPNAASGCKICSLDGMRWIDTNSKCPSGQVCRGGLCMANIPLDPRLSVVHVAGNYPPTDNTFMIDGAREALSLGFRSIEIDASPELCSLSDKLPKGAYHTLEYCNGNTGRLKPDIRNMSDLLNRSQYQEVLNLPFDTFILTVRGGDNTVNDWAVSASWDFQSSCKV